MLKIETIDSSDKRQRRRFVEIPFQFYTNTPQWVPPIRVDIETMLDKKKHPFYEHSDGEFYIATCDGKDVGRLAVFENVNFNKYHGTKKAQFYFFECEDNQETAEALFEPAFDWAKKRGMDTMIGPKGLGPLDGYGVLVEGFENRQMMTMMNYNHPYIRTLLENMGFEKEVDFVSCYIHTPDFHIPERIHSISERVQKRGTLKVKRFKNKKELIAWAPKIGKTYNETFINNWEYVRLTDNEVKFVIDNILMVAHPKMIKIITNANDDVVGFLFAFPDISAALQRSKGRLMPFGLIDILLEMRRTPWVALNGEGILQEYQGLGGNALLYAEIDNTLREFPRFIHADLTQVAETAVQMRSDLINLGGKRYKNHRVFRRTI